MKHTIQFTLTLLFSCLTPLHAEETQPYQELVQARLKEAIVATSQLPERLWKPNPGQGIYKALLFLTENQNIEKAERIIAAHCGNPLTEYLGKPVPQSRNEALCRVYLTNKMRERLSQKAVGPLTTSGPVVIPGYTPPSRDELLLIQRPMTAVKRAGLINR